MKIGTLVTHNYSNRLGIIISYVYGFQQCQQCNSYYHCYSRQYITEFYYPIYYFTKFDESCPFINKNSVFQWKES